MSEKYIDLIHAIESSDSMTGCERVTVEAVLAWLDFHPDQVPGRTITRSVYRDTLNGAVLVSGYGDDWERGFSTGIVVAGAKVVADPEPTNAEKLAEDLKTYAGLDLKTAQAVAEDMTREGWAKAPGGDDEH